MKFKDTSKTEFEMIRGNRYQIDFKDEFSSFKGPARFVRPCSENENICYGGETGEFICEDTEEEGYFFSEHVVELLEKSEFAKIMDQLGIDGVDEETIARLISLYNLS